MPEARVNGIRLYYEEHGAGAPIACVHGTGSSAVVWSGAVEKLAGRGRVIAYDRRGCTRSERPQPYEVTTVAQHADDLAALLDTVAATPAVIVGRSYGGEVALDLAHRSPERVRALVLLEGAPLAVTPGGTEWEDDLGDRLQEVDADAVGQALVDSVLGEEMWPMFPDELRRLFTDNGPAILAEARGHGLRTDPAELATIGHPALLVAASDSPAIFRAATAALAGLLPNARTSTVGGGHMVDPAGPDVLRFIEEVLG